MKKILDIAMNIAIEAHSGQVDKGGIPYIFHPFHIASKMDNDEERIVAILHDVIEDSEFTEKDLINRGISVYLVHEVVALTRPVDMNYFDYINIVKQYVIATKVKLVDLQQNMDISRIQNPSEKDYKRVEKYKKAYSILTSDSVDL